MRKRTKGMFTVCILSLTFIVCSTVTAAQKIEIIIWNHLNHQPKYQQSFNELGEKFSEQHPNVKVKLVGIPYEGYEGRYLATLRGKIGAPDIFLGMAHRWTPEGFADPMPADLSKFWDENLPAFMSEWGTYDGVRYGIPANGQIQMLYLNVDMFDEAGLDSEKPPKTLSELAEYAKKLTKPGQQWGFAIRYKGSKLGIADKFLPVLHVFGGRLMNPLLNKSSGYVNSDDSIAAFRYYYDLVNTWKVASLKVGKPSEAMARGLAAMMFREPAFVEWLKVNAPERRFTYHPFPVEKKDYAPSNLLPWVHMVYKYSPNKKWAWEYMRFISTPEHDLYQHLVQNLLPCIRENYESDYVRNLPYYPAVSKMLDRPIAPTYYTPRISETAYAAADGLLDVVYGQKTPEETANILAAKIDNILYGK